MASIYRRKPPIIKTCNGCEWHSGDKERACVWPRCFKGMGAKRYYAGVWDKGGT